MMTMAFIIIIVITSMPAVASSVKFGIDDKLFTQSKEFQEFVSPVLLSVVLGVEVVHIDLVMIVRDHRLLATGMKKN